MIEDADITLVRSYEEARQFIEWCELHHRRVAIDTETSGFEWHDRVRTFQVGDDKTAWVIPMDSTGYGGLVKDGLSRLIGADFIMHNFKFDQAMLAKDGLELPDERVIDTRIMAHIVDPTRPTGLKELADRMIGPYSSHGEKRLKEIFTKNRWDWDTIPIDVPEYWSYGGLDTILTCRIYDELWPKVFPRFQRIYDLEYACQVVLKGVERRGVLLDKRYTSEMSEALLRQADELRARALELYGVENLTSTDQVAKVLMSEGWEPIYYTETGKPSMTRDVLNSLEHPLATMCVEVKHLEKMAGSQYLGGYLSMVDPDGMIHCNINPIGARTGRMSIKQPALQTLHRDALVRDAFVPRPGNKLILADYDQMEVRELAHFCQDENYIKVILESDDVHSATAAQIFGCQVSDVTKKQRQLAKNSVYAIIYGAGIDKFAMTANITVDEARQFFHQYNSAFPGVQRFKDAIEDIALSRYKTEGSAYLMSPYGRRHPLGDYETFGTKMVGDKEVVDGPVYKLVNYLIQGTGADILKTAIVDADRAGISQYLVLLVHDEMGWDVPDGEVEEVQHTVREVMEDRTNFSVPLTVGVGVYDRWGSKYR